MFTQFKLSARDEGFETHNPRFVQYLFLGSTDGLFLLRLYVVNLIQGTYLCSSSGLSKKIWVRPACCRRA